MKHHFQCAEQVKSPSNLTKYCACHEILKLKIWAETPWSASANRKTIRAWSDHNPNTKSSSRTRRLGDLPGPILETILYRKIQHFALRPFPKMSRHAAPATKSHTPTSPNSAPATRDFTELSLDGTVTLLDLLLYGTVTLLNCYFTELCLDWAVTLLNCTWRNCYFMELLLYWTVTWRNCDFTELLLYRTVTLLNCDFIEVLLYWTVTLLICYLTDLLLDWTVSISKTS